MDLLAPVFDPLPFQSLLPHLTSFLWLSNLFCPRSRHPRFHQSACFAEFRHRPSHFKAFCSTIQSTLANLGSTSSNSAPLLSSFWPHLWVYSNKTPTLWAFTLLSCATVTNPCSQLLDFRFAYASRSTFILRFPFSHPSRSLCPTARLWHTIATA